MHYKYDNDNDDYKWHRFLQAGCPSCQITASKHLKKLGNWNYYKEIKTCELSVGGLKHWTLFLIIVQWLDIVDLQFGFEDQNHLPSNRQHQSYDDCLEI